jgi:hypothetical protein
MKPNSFSAQIKCLAPFLDSHVTRWRRTPNNQWNLFFGADFGRDNGGCLEGYFATVFVLHTGRDNNVFILSVARTSPVPCRGSFWTANQGSRTHLICAKSDWKMIMNSTQTTGRYSRENKNSRSRQQVPLLRFEQDTPQIPPQKRE